MVQKFNKFFGGPPIKPTNIFKYIKNKKISAEYYHKNRNNNNNNCKNKMKIKLLIGYYVLWSEKLKPFIKESYLLNSSSEKKKYKD